MSEKEADTLYCSFCSKSQHDVRKLIAGDSVFICNECIDVCNNIMIQTPFEAGDEVAEEPASLPTPKKIKSYLDEYIVGQDKAKVSVSVAVYNHYKRINNPVVEGVKIKKANMVLLGPTGSGKTLLAETVARYLDVPFVMADCTTLTESGYVGEDVETVIARLLAAADGNVEKTQRGIVFLDEVDKLRAKSSASGQRDISGEGVQQCLLKMLEGSEVMVTPLGGKKNSGADVKVDTSNILFIVSGAFVGLDKIVAEDSNKGMRAIGFGKTAANLSKREALSEADVTPDHLVKFGLIPELVGRLPVIAALDELDEEQLLHVLTVPKNAIVKQYEALFKLDDVEIEFAEEALRAIANIAIKRKTGARGLHGVLEGKLTAVQFDLPDLAAEGTTKVIIGADVFTGDGVPELVKGITEDA